MMNLDPYQPYASGLRVGWTQATTNSSPACRCHTAAADALRRSKPPAANPGPSAATAFR